jgi:hypothetical protein
LVRPEKVHDVVVGNVVQEGPAGTTMTVYPVRGAPPSGIGADHVSVAVAFPPSVLTLARVISMVAGVTDVETVGPSPTAFVATAEKV